MRHALGVLLVALVVSPGPARADGQTERALRALETSSSLKVRSQAALVLGEIGTPEVLPALRKAATGDAAPAVRIAAVAALAKIGAPEVREVLAEVQRTDPDEGVRASAASALAAFKAPAHVFRGREVVLEETVGDGGRPADRVALRTALGRRLQEAGFQVGKDGLRLKPSIVRLDVERASEKTIIAVRAELVAVEGGGRMAAMLEGAARLSATGTLGERDLNAASNRAMDAVAKILVEDLAAKLAER
jgi:HEAT repeat protein